ncbi:MAG: hypothetical protein AUG51_22970 [Acidobacteria bacterium 13_1_20CM_3_53_8]|nr:MAG: hypothetical protein AUG51_22970 [Acidobacteria bacterium 13_1_20CM_3_53_8]
MNQKPFSRRSAFIFLITLALVSPALPQGAGVSDRRASQTSSASSVTRDPRMWREAMRIHRSAIVIDGHNDITTTMTNDNYDLGGDPPAPYRTSLARLKKGGMTGEFFSLYVRPWYVTHGGAARRTLDMIDSVYRAVERHPNDLLFATSAADIRRAKQQGKVAALMGIEGGHAIENSLPTLREFYRLGVRYMTLTWNNTNDWADAGRGEHTHHGLTDFGREVVREMNRLGMLVDVAHVSDETMSDALDTSKVPIIASHSSARALNDQPRNIPDDLLRRIAKNGGIVMVNFYQVFIDPAASQPNRERSAQLKAQEDEIEQRFKNDPERIAEEEDRLEAQHPLPATPISILIDHIDHIVQVAGIDHVGLGADFDGAVDMPEGARDVSELPNITYELLRRGYSERDIRKILGENFLRVFGQVEAYARRNGGHLSGQGSTRRIPPPVANPNR